MNTKLALMYRDASNYKAHRDVVVEGEITEAQIAAIASKLQDGEFFIANQVGLPTPSFQFCGKDGWPSDDLDHVFTTLTDFSDGNPAVKDLLTDFEPTEDMTITKLAALFDAIESPESWNVGAEWNRMLEAA